MKPRKTSDFPVGNLGQLQTVRWDVLLQILCFEQTGSKCISKALDCITQLFSLESPKGGSFGLPELVVSSR